MKLGKYIDRQHVINAGFERFFAAEQPPTVQVHRSVAGGYTMVQAQMNGRKQCRAQYSVYMMMIQNCDDIPSYTLLRLWFSTPKTRSICINHETWSNPRFKAVPINIPQLFSTMSSAFSTIFDKSQVLQRWPERYRTNDKDKETTSKRWLDITNEHFRTEQKICTK